MDLSKTKAIDPPCSVERAAIRGTSMAARKVEHFGIMLLKHSISGNPYCRSLGRKKEHTAWHNAFYKKRKEMQRSVW